VLQSVAEDYIRRYGRLSHGGDIVDNGLDQKLPISVAVCFSVLQCVAVRVRHSRQRIRLEVVHECCRVLQCVAVCGSVLQCVANSKHKRRIRLYVADERRSVSFCCSVSQCVAV